MSERNEELKLEFNTLYNNISSNQAAGVNDYEISQFLTLALEQIVEEVYTGRYTNSGFEKTELIRKSIDSLLRKKEIVPVIDSSNIFDTEAYTANYGVTPTEQDPHPDEVMFVVMEWASISKDDKERTIEVIPIKYDDFLRTYKNPFRGTNKNRAIRIDTDGTEATIHIEKGYTLNKYIFEYVKKPRPIIIGNSDFSSLTINGYPANVDSECELDSFMDKTIVLRAVQLAKAAWQSK